MTKEEVIQALIDLRRDRGWLAKVTGYTEDTVMNKLGPSGSISQRMMDSFERAILNEKEEPLQDVNESPKAVVEYDIWDLVQFNGGEVKRIVKGKEIGGYKKIEDFYHDAVIDFADQLIASGDTDDVDNENIYYLPFLGYAAAGDPVTTQLEDESLPVPKSYPDGYFIVEVNGQSMEPTLMDGDRVVCEPKEYTPANNKIYVVSDGYGSSIKRFLRSRKAFISDNPSYGDLTPLEDVKIQGVYIEKL